MQDRELQEIREDIRMDKILAFWRQYNRIIIGALVAITLVVVAGLFISHNRAQSRAQSSEILLKYIQSHPGSKESTELYDTLLSALSPYPTLANLVRGGQPSAGDDEADIKALEAVRTDPHSDATLREGALVLLSLRRLEEATFPKELEVDLERLGTSQSPWALFGREMRAFIAFKRDEPKALDLFRELSHDAQATPSMRQRAQAMMDKIETEK